MRGPYRAKGISVKVKGLHFHCTVVCSLANLLCVHFGCNKRPGIDFQEMLNAIIYVCLSYIFRKELPIVILNSSHSEWM